MFAYKRTSALFLTVLLLQSAFIHLIWAQESSFKIYSNARFGFSIQYPEALIAQGESANGDGQEFVSSDQKTILRVYGEHNALQDSLIDRFKREQNGSRTITYKILKKNFFVLSGIENEKIFYTKVYQVDDQFKTVWIEYPLSQQTDFGPIVERISKSFHLASK